MGKKMDVSKKYISLLLLSPKTFVFLQVSQGNGKYWRENAKALKLTQFSLPFHIFFHQHIHLGQGSVNFHQLSAFTLIAQI